MLKLLFSCVLGLVGAIVVHGAVVLLAPHMTTNDVVSRVSRLIGENELMIVEKSRGLELGFQAGDPLVEIGLCRFSLLDNPFSIRAQGGVAYWSASIINERGENVFSFNRRTSNQRDLDFLVATPRQLIDVRQSPIDDLTTAVIFEGEIESGLVVLRVIAPDPTWATLTRAFFDSVKCLPYDPEIGVIDVGAEVTGATNTPAVKK
jgi:uncharacterized membrane protein